MKTVEPRGGVNHYDIDGRLVGNWFLKGSMNGDEIDTGSNPYYFYHLGIIYHNNDPEVIQLSFSDAFSMSGQYRVCGNMPDPAEVGVEQGLVKYEMIKNSSVANKGNCGSTEEEILGVVLIQMSDDRTIMIEQFPNSTADEIDDFTENALIFER